MKTCVAFQGTDAVEEQWVEVTLVLTLPIGHPNVDTRMT